jgi:flavin-dependent dehydrogenase
MLAQRGFRVALLEKAHHPRFHIGESLLPANLPLFEQFGVANEVRAIGIEKWAAEFISPSDGRRQEFEFAGCWDKSMPFAYQVRRSELDDDLDPARRLSGRAGLRRLPREGCRIRGRRARRARSRKSRGWDLVRLGGAISRRCLGPRYVSRQPAAFEAAQQEAQQRRDLRAFHGARRHPGKREGNISIFWFDHGWFWFIPLADGATSVGAVVWPRYLKTRKVSVEEFFLATIAQCPPLAEVLAGASLAGEVQATGNYSYTCDRSCGGNYFLVGDAYAFIDPVFSSGVMLAMQSAVAAADAIESCLREPARAASARRRFDRMMRHGPRHFSWFIYRVTNPTMREMFLGPRNIMRVQEALLSLLAGDIFGRTPIWGSLRLFKMLYYLISLAHWRRTLLASRRRSCDIRSVETEQRPAG